MPYHVSYAMPQKYKNQAYKYMHTQHSLSLVKEARVGCGLKNRLREFFFIYAYVIFMVFRGYLGEKNHTSPLK